MKKHKSVKIKGSSFGKYYDFDIPTDCDCVVIAINVNGLVPVSLCLPHQVYVQDVKEHIIVLQEKGYCTSQITIIPVRSKEYVDLGECKYLNNPTRMKGWYEKEVLVNNARP